MPIDITTLDAQHAIELFRNQFFSQQQIISNWSDYRPWSKAIKKTIKKNSQLSAAKPWNK